MDRKIVFEMIFKASIDGDLGLFIGAGLPMALLNNEGEHIALSWKELIFKCANELGVDIISLNIEGCSYPEIASRICKMYSQNKNKDYLDVVAQLKRIISNNTSWYPNVEKRKEYQEYFKALDPNWIITTNYDLLIESILLGKGYSLSPNDLMIAPKNMIPVYHLHGARTSSDSIIITQEDYTALFRPNQYRQHKLALTIRESLTLLIGYSLGDINVLTAVDWSKNVYVEQKVKYDNNIIQLLYKKDCNDNVYIDNNDIIIVEFSDLSAFFADLTDYIKKESFKYLAKKAEIEKVKAILENLTAELIEKFTDDEDFRKMVIKILKNNYNDILSGFLELVTKSIALTWERAAPKSAFFAYNQNLKILLDILEDINVKNIPPALFELIAYNLNRVSSYIGNSMGDSHDAYNSWQNRKKNIPTEMKDELINISKARTYRKLIKLLLSE